MHDLYTMRDAEDALAHSLSIGHDESADLAVGDMLTMLDAGTDHLHLWGARQRVVTCDLLQVDCPMSRWEDWPLARDN